MGVTPERKPTGVGYYDALAVEQETARGIADKIRRELVCCDINRRDGRGACFWGEGGACSEAAARIAETYPEEKYT